jgi:tight adherence protein C
MNGDGAAFAILGAIAGLGLVLALAGAARRRRPPPSGRPPSLVAIGLDLEQLLGRVRPARHDADLAVTDRTLERQATSTALGAIVGGLFPAMAFGLAAYAGWHPPAASLPAACVAGVALGAALPFFALHKAAGEARTRFRRSLCCWLELVALAQAGGMGVEGALDSASRIGSDRAFTAIREALRRARDTGTTPWHALGRLGRELGIDELEELAASLALAGAEGAKVRESLSAKASALRRRQLSEEAAQANATTERLFLPSIVLMLGFVVFLLYPAASSLGHVL